MQTAVIGLGSMGFGMAQSILRAGHTTYGYDLNPEQVASFQQIGGVQGALKQIAETLDAVVVVVLNASQTEDVLFGENGIAASLKPGAIVIGCATVAPELARDMAARCAALG